MKFIVWVRVDGRWEEQGDGPLTAKQAERIAREIKKDCHCFTKILPEGVEP